MKEFKVSPEFVITDERSLRTMFPAQTALAVHKVQGSLDKHAQAFIGRSPFLCIGTQDLAGRADVSPRGDPVGFVKILDQHTLAIPDRPGNNRLDSLVNILANPTVGLLFIIPGFDDTLRVNGQASLVTDAEILARMGVGDRIPKLAIVVKVSEVFMHCAKGRSPCGLGLRLARDAGSPAVRASAREADRSTIRSGSCPRVERSNSVTVVRLNLSLRQ